jgi:hypothetical protein
MKRAHRIKSNTVRGHKAFSDIFSVHDGKGNRAVIIRQTMVIPDDGDDWTKDGFTLLFKRNGFNFYRKELAFRVETLAVIIGLLVDGLDDFVYQIKAKGRYANIEGDGVFFSKKVFLNPPPSSEIDAFVQRCCNCDRPGDLFNLDSKTVETSIVKLDVCR